MATGYSRELVINSFLHRYETLPQRTVNKLQMLAEKLYDEVGKDRFRVYGNVTPECIREYRQSV